MATALVPCSACSRHVKTNEHVCPFCGAPRAAGTGADTHAIGLSPTAQGLSRAALLIAGAAVIAACGKESSALRPDGPSAAVYGGPPVMVDPSPTAAPSVSASPQADAGASAGAKTDAGAPRAK